MRKILCTLLLCSIALVGFAQQKKETRLAIIPQPSSVTVTDAKPLLLGKEIILQANTDECKEIAAFIKEYFASTDTKKAVTIIDNNTSTVKNQTVIKLSLQRTADLATEGAYALNVSANGVEISAPTSAGVFYGTQTLLQILSQYPTSIPALAITDAPRFSYRGIHLDVGRHMYPVAFIKKFIDLMAFHKFNRFHWHLTEDQGWRIEIKQYPKLQEIAAYRKETVIGKASSKNPGKNFDGQRYGGYYTQEEIKDVVAYAKQRYVTVVPEIELPGHAQAALSAYSELGCTGGPYAAATTWGVFPEVFCAGKEETFTFLQNVLDETLALFPSEYIHIGGDECPKTRWQACPHCQKRMKDEGLKDEHELQSYFIQRIEKYLNSKGRRIIGWDEILEGGLAPDATVMSWRGEEGGIAAAKQKHDVIMTPGDWCYFDKFQADPKNEPLAIGGFLPVKKVYEYEPVPPQLSADEAKHVLGAQANVWTEYIKTSDHVEYMVYPRAVAMAEVVWSAKEVRNYDDFLKRLEIHLKRLDVKKVNYAKHVKEEFKK
ncbi:beta-N-acetylhexosaminidase [Pseudochryseolinea flava]|uniref:beta-N-acetylhexosaminidase n=1 Tax=Pseudochryseolinea flava TaxID=2059302 RepID=A0A364Y5T4_9BACT|nr:beta-N-acetylhexosaminidase [Pseudochryseolinea flava]RAW01721.1 beta-N-acetylglucosaminidase [Pseudochryseolinea flava]